MKTKRFLALLLALLISLSTLFGCIDFKDDGGYDSSHSEDANDENSPSSPSDDGNSGDTGTTKPSDNTDSSHGGVDGPDQSDTQTSSDPLESISISEIPEFDGKTPFVVINGNRPFFFVKGCDGEK